MAVALPTPAASPRLLEVLQGRRLVALTGAGCSTESGIPDYRGKGTRQRAKNPIQYREFAGSESARRRYWARSFAGWPRFRAARPNPAHQALADLEATGQLCGIITQNVDGLHQAAGSRRVVELHGSLGEVRCLGCGAISSRDRLQERLHERNPSWRASDLALAPDGDAELTPERIAGFRHVGCESCAGVLKPNVVFFGEGVPRDVVDAAWSLFDQAEVLLVLGSSLAVFSGFRFVRRAAARGVPVAIVNEGPSRGDELAVACDRGRLGQVLPALALRLGCGCQ